MFSEPGEVFKINIHIQAKPFFLPGKQDGACLFIHGFGASPSEVYPVARLINEMGGYTVKGPLLPGHGLAPEKLNLTTWQDWYGAVENELAGLADNYARVLVVGLSMGGLLALHTACNHEGLMGAVSINAPVYNNFPGLTFLAPVFRLVKPYYPKNDLARLKALEEQGRFAYLVTPVKAFQSMLQLRQQVVGEIKNIKIPLLIMQSLRDESVHPRSGRFLAEMSRHNSSSLVQLPRSEHIATMGPEKEIIAGEIIKFMSQVSQGDGSFDSTLPQYLMVHKKWSNERAAVELGEQGD